MYRVGQKSLTLYVTIIGHDGNVDGHEVVGSSSVERQCAPAADTERMKNNVTILACNKLLVTLNYSLKEILAEIV